MARDDVPAGGLIGSVPAPALHVMSLNIRRRVVVPLRRADAWVRRAPRLQALLRAERPSILGVQEALPDQIAVVAHALGGDYERVGGGREADGGGEACPILFDAGRLELQAWDQAALSDHPLAPGSRTWGNLVPRILVAVTLRDRRTGSELLVMNTHFDHLSRRSRLRSALAVHARASASMLPTIVTGDVNTGEGSAPLRALLDDGVLVDSWTAAVCRLTPEWGTFANYRRPRVTVRRIDRILVSPQIEVARAAVNPRRHDGGWASDHLPVQAVILLPGESGAA